MLSHDEIRTRDGQKIGLTVYSPGSTTNKVMIMAATGGVSQNFYEPFAGFFQRHGFTVITFDYRGVGRSAPEELKGYNANMHQWAVQDIDAVILYARHNCPKHEIIYVGHCVGGEIVGLAQASQYINKLVLVNSALSCKKLWPLKQRFKIIAIKPFIALLNKWFGYFPGKKIGYDEDLPAGVMHEWANWCSKSNGLFDAFPDNNYRKLRIPLLAYSFSDNWKSPPKAVQELLNRFANAYITWHHIRPIEMGRKAIGHYGFFYPEMEASLWLKLLQWVNEGERIKKPVVDSSTLSNKNVDQKD
ncbi:MAG TPA: alpha/beta fold hydrolase [Chitinophagaceae bacterium]